MVSKGASLKMRDTTAVFLVICAACLVCQGQSPGTGPDTELFTKPEGVVTRWSSFENIGAEKGAGGRENQAAKGHAFDSIQPGETKVLLDVKGSGTLRRIWLTLQPRDPGILRALRLEMTWDGTAQPAVSVPLGDFFNWVHGRPAKFENALFANPEGRSFVCFIPMPFRRGARVSITNDSDTPISHLFYDINITLGDKHGPDVMYFHASWRRERMTKLAEDFAILPRVRGSGRFIGCHVGVIGNQEYLGWWGEGEVKIYLDGDEQSPTLCGTGTEDYIATAWGQGEYGQRYHGSLEVDNEKQRYSFYRYHIPDPVYFDTDCHVTLQQIGGSNKANVVQMLGDSIDIRPVSADKDGHFVKLLEPGAKIDLLEDIDDSAWVNYYRRDDVSAVAFFYLKAPVSNLPALPPVGERVAGLK
jgi:hypothetical protein